VRTWRLLCLSLIVGATHDALWQSTAGAQPAERVSQIGALSYGTGPVPPEAIGRFADFEAGLCERGWIKGRNVAAEYRCAKGGILRPGPSMSDTEDSDGSGSKTGAKPRSSNAQKRHRASGARAHNRCRFCAMVADAALPEVTLNQQVQTEVAPVSWTVNN
jgi:hypothetical protein